MSERDKAETILLAILNTSLAVTALALGYALWTLMR